MDENNDYLSSYEDDYKSYKNYLEDFNPDDYECDYWEDIQPDIDRMADEFEKQMESEIYGYDMHMSAEELDRRLSDEFYE